MNKFSDLTKLLSNAEAVPNARHDQDAASFGEETPAITERLHRGLKRPIVLGMLVVVFLVVGLLVWATISSISGAVLAGGTVRVENNSKEVRHLEAGVISKIFVHEGQRVRRGQVLIRFETTQAQASVDVYQSAVDGARAQIARFQAEAVGARDITFPPELTRRADDPQVAMLMAAQRNLFVSRMMLYRSQAAVLRSQAEQLGTQVAGLRAQVAATSAQSGLIGDELNGVRELNELGYAPRSRLLALQRNAAGLHGQRGSLMSDISRTQQAIGDVRIQLAQLDEKRQTEAADGLRTAQAQLTEAEPKLTAVANSLRQTDVVAPVDGYVFNLTQFTEGGVATGGERLLNVVPFNSRLVIEARVRPNDISDVKVGMPARVTFTGYNPRTTPRVDGRVILVSADAKADEASKESYYVVHIKVEPAELAKAPNVRLTPGMPAQVAIVTSSRTILDYLLGPLTESMRSSLRER